MFCTTYLVVNKLSIYLQGDSGGPLACYNDELDVYELQGATSFGVDCGETREPGGFTNVHFFKEWIEQFMEK